MQVVRAALLDAGACSSQLAAVQLHGTGTALGDPIEMGAITAVASGAVPQCALDLESIPSGCPQHSMSC